MTFNKSFTGILFLFLYVLGLFGILFLLSCEIETPSQEPQTEIQPIPENFVPQTFEWYAKDVDFKSVKKNSSKMLSECYVILTSSFTY